MKLTGKWTRKERIAVVNAALFYFAKQTSEGTLTQDGMFRAITALHQTLNAPAKELTHNVRFMEASQGMLDAQGESRLVVINSPQKIFITSTGSNNN
jgi:hypothetical protein